MALILTPGQTPTSITLHTRARTSIANSQARILPASVISEIPNVEAAFGVTFLTDPTAMYNCHGLTFASRRTWLQDDLRTILQEDNYSLLHPSEVMPGDVILYVNPQGVIAHSGIVVTEPVGPQKLPMVRSKWGMWPETVHHTTQAPYYNCTYLFYRIRS